MVSAERREEAGAPPQSSSTMSSSTGGAGAGGRASGASRRPGTLALRRGWPEAVWMPIIWAGLAGGFRLFLGAVAGAKRPLRFWPKLRELRRLRYAVKCRFLGVEVELAFGAWVDGVGGEIEGVLDR